MAFFMPFLIGFIASFGGVFPPGLVNMTAARISLQESKQQAFYFSIGAIFIVLFQSYIAVVFARYIEAHQEVMMLLREVGFGIFTLLTIYFFFFAKKPKEKLNEKIKLKSKKSRFFLGMLISALNFFPIPYYVIVSLSAVSYGYFEFSQIANYGFVLGTALGSFLIFSLYAAFFKKMESKTEFLLHNMNYIMGTITGLVSISTLYNILNHYYHF